MDIALLVQETSHGRKLFLQIRRHFLQHQAFAGVIQYRHLFGPHFLQNAVAESTEAQDIDIQDAIPVTAHDQILLGLHGELIRHNDQEIPARLLCRPLHDLFIDSVAFARPGRAKTET